MTTYNSAQIPKTGHSDVSLVCVCVNTFIELKKKTTLSRNMNLKNNLIQFLLMLYSEGKNVKHQQASAQTNTKSTKECNNSGQQSGGLDPADPLRLITTYKTRTWKICLACSVCILTLHSPVGPHFPLAQFTYLYLLYQIETTFLRDSELLTHRLTLKFSDPGLLYLLSLLLLLFWRGVPVVHDLQSDDAITGGGNDIGEGHEGITRFLQEDNKNNVFTSAHGAA